MGREEGCLFVMVGGGRGQQHLFCLWGGGVGDWGGGVWLLKALCQVGVCVVCACVFPERPCQWYRTLGMVIGTPGERTATTASDRSLSGVKALAAYTPVVAMPARELWLLVCGQGMQPGTLCFRRVILLHVRER